MTGRPTAAPDLEPLPVSAVAAGLAPARGGQGTPSGSDIAADALAEQAVALAAQRYFARLPRPG